jgi:hypothetical protein
MTRISDMVLYLAMVGEEKLPMTWKPTHKILENGYEPVEVLCDKDHPDVDGSIYVYTKDDWFSGEGEEREPSFFYLDDEWYNIYGEPMDGITVVEIL